MRDMWHAFLRLFFRLLYNEFAWGYDLVAWLVSLGQWKAWGRTAYRHLHGSRVLELGHGPGHLLVALSEQGLEPVGLELSRHMARQAKRRLGRADLDALLVQARAQALPFRRGVFDSIVATFPTDYIVHLQTMREAERVLVPHGHLIVAITARFEGKNLLLRFLTWLYRVTGQNHLDFDIVGLWLEQTGFSWRIVWEQVHRTTVTLVVAEKD